MSLFVEYALHDGTKVEPQYRIATRDDLFAELAREWTCQTCKGSGHNLSMGPPHAAQGLNPPNRGSECTYCKCPDCVGGFNPPDNIVKRVARAHFESMGARSNLGIDRYPEDQQQSMRDKWDWGRASEAVRSWFYIDARAALVALVEGEISLECDHRFTILTIPPKCEKCGEEATDG